MLVACAERNELETPEDLGQFAQAIEGGYGDLVDRSVVGLAVTNADGDIEHTCSGVLIAPNLVLTAQHCVANTPRFVHCDQAVFGPPELSERVYVTFDDSMWGNGVRWIPVAKVIPPPGDRSVCGRDVALLRLNALIHEGATPLTPRLDEEVTAGESYSAVGFGASGQNANDAGRRRRRDHLEIVCVGQSCGATSHVQEPEWLGDHGICNGDSGGPAIDAAGRVIGVTSRGPLGCDDPIYGGLIDFKDWIQGQAIQAANAGNYLAASWTGAGLAPVASHHEADTAAISCALSASGASGGAPGATLLLVAMLALRRRRV